MIEHCNVWNAFDAALGRHQPLPPERMPVLVEVEAWERGCPNPLVVGYLRYAAGDGDAPQFIVPGLAVRNPDGFPRIHRILQWSDCIPGFTYNEVRGRISPTDNATPESDSRLARLGP